MKIDLGKIKSIAADSKVRAEAEQARLQAIHEAKVLERRKMDCERVRANIQELLERAAFNNNDVLQLIQLGPGDYTFMNSGTSDERILLKQPEHKYLFDELTKAGLDVVTEIELVKDRGSFHRYFISVRLP